MEHVLVLPAEERQHHLATGHELPVAQPEEQREVLLELPPVQRHHRRRRGLPDVHVALVDDGASGELVGDLGAPHEAVGGVEEVDAAVREQPRVEGARQPGDVVRRQRVPLVLDGQLLEQLQGLEHEVEVVPGQVVQEELHVLRLGASGHCQILSPVGDGSEHLGDDEQRVGPRRAAEVRDDHGAAAGGERRRVRRRHGLVEHRPRLQYGLLLKPGVGGVAVLAIAAAHVEVALYLHGYLS